MKHFLYILGITTMDLLLAVIFIIIIRNTALAGDLDAYMYKDSSDELYNTASLISTDIEQMKADYEKSQYNNRSVSESEISDLIPHDNTLMGRISVPSVNVDIPLYNGDTDSILNKGAGVYAGNGGTLPGYNGLSLICSHNGAYQFGPLENAVVGDRVNISADYGEFEYTIYEIRVVEATDSTAYDFSVTEDELIVYTCSPSYYNYTTPYRLFLYCKKTDGITIVK